MKKFFLLILMMILIPLTVNAEDYKVIEHYIDSEIEIAGGLTVRELIIVEGCPEIFNRKVNYFSFGNEKWDGKEVDLESGTIYNGSSIETLAVTAFEAPEKVDFNDLKKGATVLFKKLDLRNPSDNTYLGSDKKDGTFDYKVYYSGNAKKTAYYLEYSVTGVTVKHNDIKEINYSFKNLDFNEGATIIRMLLPYPTSDSKYKAYVHGNKNGVLEPLKYNEQDVGVAVSFDKIDSTVNFRMLIPDNLVGMDSLLKNSKIDAISEIEAIEADRLDNTETRYKIIDFMKWVLISLAIIYLLVLYFVIRINNNLIDIIYLLFGLFIMLFNFLFKYNLWYLYIVILIPIIGKLLRKYIVK